MKKFNFTLNARRAFTLIEVMLVMGAVVTMAGLGIAGMREQGKRNAGMACGNNLRLIQEAKRAYLEEHPTATSFTDAQLAQYLPNGVMPQCPGHGTYNGTSSVNQLVTCTLNSGASDGMHNPYTPGNPAPPVIIKSPIRPHGPIEIGPIDTDPVEIEAQ